MLDSTKQRPRCTRLLEFSSEGKKFGAKNFMTFDGMTPERAEELESYKKDMTEEEIAMIVDCLPPIPGLDRFRRKTH